VTRLALIVLAFFTLTGAIDAGGGGVDPHIQTVMYDPGQVVEIRGAFGWQVMIEFAADERIENVSIGDSLAWQVTPNKRARMLFLKPLSRNASTNMTVITSQRRYAFGLSTGPRTASTPWIVEFQYPAEPPVAMLPEPAPPAPPALNFGYVRTGSPAVMPTRVWDDGRQTYFEFAPGMPFPAIFAGGPGKKDESLVNVVTRGRIQVVQQTGPRFILRAGPYSAAVTRETSR
jgi:type IV secretion system protein VirB9